MSVARSGRGLTRSRRVGDVDFDDGTDSATRNLFYVELHSSGYDVSGRIGPTDFDYADRPCYYDCADGVTDDFDRTVSAGLGTSTVGLVWVDDSSYGGVTNGLSVDGSAAVFADIYTSGGFPPIRLLVCRLW